MRVTDESTDEYDYKTTLYDYKITALTFVFFRFYFEEFTLWIGFRSGVGFAIPLISIRNKIALFSVSEIRSFRF